MDAYRYFFPAGFFFGIWGVLVWILFPWGLISYPGIRHPDIMMGAFFLCFVCGFLMTAAPKFLSTFGPSAFEQKISWSLIALLFFTLLLPERWYFLAAVNLLFFNLAIFLVRRFFKRKSNPPDSFLLVGFGLLSGMIGCGILTYAEFSSVSASSYQLGRLFFLQAYILYLVLGVGSRLIPALLGYGSLPRKNGEPSQIALYAFLSFLFFLSFILETYFSARGGNLLRALVISFLCFKFWKLYKMPLRKGFQPFWLWSSGWLLVLGQWGIVLFPRYRIHLLHIILVSGLALMTLMIAVRVSLSHGKHDLSLEKNSRSLWIAAFLLAFAGMTRFSAGVLPDLYQSHLTYAAYTWVIGAILWGWVYIPKMIFIKK